MDRNDIENRLGTARYFLARAYDEVSDYEQEVAELEQMLQDLENE